MASDVFYLFHEGLGKVISKWEFREDAKDELQEMKESGLKGLKVLTPTGVRRKVGKIVYAKGKEVQSLFTRRNPSSDMSARIEQLMYEAGGAGDMEMVKLCRAALAGDEDAYEECVDVIEEEEARHNPRHPVYTLGDFQRLTTKIDHSLGAAYNYTLTVKGMFDTFEEIPSDQLPLYDAAVKLMFEIGEARQKAYQLAMKFKRYK